MFGILLLCVSSECLMIKKECPSDEIHKSCSFYEEYTCWEDTLKNKRMMVLPQRLNHCKTGCFCRKGSVRAYRHGPCIPAPLCRNQRIQMVLSKLPSRNMEHSFIG